MDTMKERPIPFSAPMIRAILDGSKSQTRRVIKPQPDSDAIITVGEIGTSRGAAYVRYPREGGITLRIPCPYGQPSDQLWVREAWRTAVEANTLPPRDLNAAHRLWFEADAPHQIGFGKLRASMFMPRWASRIQLEITGVRVERLNDISGADALREGVRIPTDMQGRPLLRLTGSVGPSKIKVENPCQWTAEEIARLEYANLWESINGPGSWDANPWVWAIDFKRI